MKITKSGRRNNKITDLYIFFFTKKKMDQIQAMNLNYFFGGPRLPVQKPDPLSAEKEPEIVVELEDMPPLVDD